MRDEQPLYRNEEHNFYALTRFRDVEDALIDWETFISGKGSTLDMIQAGFPMPPGMILMEDPPIHNAHRGLLSRIFTAPRMNALEPQIRQFCAESLDPCIGAGGFDFIKDLGAHMPMRAIGMLLGIPEQDQEAIRDMFDYGMQLHDEGEEPPPFEMNAMGLYNDYVEWREKNPSDDLMTELIRAEFEDPTTGEIRTLNRGEILTYILLLSGAGNETTTRLIGWMGKLLAEHPDQRREIVEDRSLLAGAVEETLRFEAPSPVQARWVTRDVELHGQVVPKDSIMLLVNGSANRDDRKFENGDTYDIHRNIAHHLSFGYRIHFCLGASLARLEGRVALDEVLNRFPEWEIDWDNAKQAHTATVRGWQRMPVVTK